jgi:restriction system-associated AAA family ATPase
MKLKRLKLNTNYRSLEKGFELNLNPNLDTSVLSPICLVGPNGSGKSNILEALADIFYYLDCYTIGYDITDENFLIPIDAFEIEYFLSKNIVNKYKPLIYDLQYNEDYFLIKIIKKESNPNPFFSITKPDGIYKLDYKNFLNLLPNKVWGYSSGNNEILSVPFLKMDLQYFKGIVTNSNTGNREIVEENRLHFVDYTTCSAILLSNFIMNENNCEKPKLNVFKEKFGIEKITFFKFTVRYSYWMKKNIAIPIEALRIIEYFKDKLSRKFFYEVEEDYIEFNILLNEENNTIIKEIFSGASGLYKFFENLNLINLHSLSKDRREHILKNNTDFYSHNNIQVPADDQKPFIINEVWVKMKHLHEPISYRTLSDGEHQALTILGLINMIDDDGNLFLLDEPETHLNPQWKYGFLKLLNDILPNKKNEVIITSHDPIFISGLKKEEVIIFKTKEQLYQERQVLRKSDSKEQIVKYWSPETDLIGKGVDWILTSEIFGLDSTFDFETKKRMIERRFLLSKKIKGENLSQDEVNRLDILTTELAYIDGFDPVNDPIYRDVLLNIDTNDFVSYYDKFITPERKVRREAIAEKILNQIKDNNNS